MDANYVAEMNLWIKEQELSIVRMASNIDLDEQMLELDKKQLVLKRERLKVAKKELDEHLLNG
jgi:lipid II:glycine glycyltransferase (peptidoglycan interpeptide bridge formation enzyme)